MIDGSTWLSVAFAVGFLACLCLALAGLTWLEHPTVPAWCRRLAAWRPRPRTEPSPARRSWCEDLVMIEGWDRGRTRPAGPAPTAREAAGSPYAVRGRPQRVFEGNRYASR